jgi:hypothetical protein
MRSNSTGIVQLPEQHLVVKRAINNFHSSTIERIEENGVSSTKGQVKKLNASAL